MLTAAGLPALLTDLNKEAPQKTSIKAHNYARNGYDIWVS
jgi:hypothetical protein